MYITKAIYRDTNWYIVTITISVYQRKSVANVATDKVGRSLSLIIDVVVG